MKLIDACEIIVDCPHTTAKDEGCGIPLVRTPNIGKGRLDLNGVHRVSKTVYNQRNERAVPQFEDLILAREAPVGNVAMITKGQKVCLGQRVVLIRPDKTIANPAYLTYYLLSDKVQHRLKNNANGAVVAHLNMNEIRNLEITLPPLDEQNRIASILTSIDDKIELNNRINHNLEEQAQTLYKSWFVDFEPFKDGKFIDSELGMIPESWHVGKIKDIVDLQSGFAFKSDSFVSNGTYKLITIKAVQDGYLTTEGADGLNDPLPPRMPEYCCLEIGDILLSLTGNVGRVCVVDKQNLLLNQRVAKLQPIKEYNRAFVYLLFRNSILHYQLIQLARGTAQLNLSPIETGDLKVIIPSDEVLLQYSNVVTPIYKAIISNKKTTISLNDIRDQILPRILSGEITC